MSLYKTFLFLCSYLLPVTLFFAEGKFIKELTCELHLVGWIGCLQLEELRMLYKEGKDEHCNQELSGA